MVIIAEVKNVSIDNNTREIKADIEIKKDTTVLKTVSRKWSLVAFENKQDLIARALDEIEEICKSEMLRLWGQERNVSNIASIASTANGYKFTLTKTTIVMNGNTYEIDETGRMTLQ